MGGASTPLRTRRQKSLLIQNGELIHRRLPEAWAALPFGRDMTQRQPNQFGRGLVMWEVAARLDDFAHPFLDGNGRVTRLMSHAWLKRLGIGDSLWSVARGLSRRVGQYKELLMAADGPRQSDVDGRGALSLASLIAFCQFFLDTCVDQVQFMETLLEPRTLSQRVERYVEQEVDSGKYSRRVFPLIREVLHVGQIQRSDAAKLLGVTDRQARNIVNELLANGVITTSGPREPLRLGFPAAAVEAWFPKLYPESPQPDIN